MQQKADVKFSDHGNPATTLDVIGQDEAFDRLLQAMQKLNPPHAWLLSGTEGIGKATIAYQIARFLLSSDVSAMTQPTHPVFRKVKDRMHPDLCVIERQIDDKKQTLAPDIQVDAVRQLQSFLSLTPSESKRRVVLVDGVNYMNRNAMNALLKSLEEPPAHTFFLMTCDHEGQLLETIHSRCVSIHFKRLDSMSMQRCLSRSLPSLSNEEYELLAVYSSGSPGMALTFHRLGILPLLIAWCGAVQQEERIFMFAIHQWIEQCLKENGQERFIPMLTLIYILNSRLMKRSLGSLQHEALLPFEQSLWQKCGESYQIQQGFVLQQHLAKLLADRQLVHLEKRTTLLGIADAMKRIF